MKIDEAIELLNEYRHDIETDDISIDDRALKLGIAALTRLRAMRVDEHILPQHLLPGETSE